jgi:hypothetical protein
MRHVPRIATLAARVLVTAAVLGGPVQAGAQTPEKSVIVEGSAGYAGFIDSPMIDHFSLGGSARGLVKPRISVGPEIVYMRGPGADRDWAFLGTVTFDLIGPSSSTRRFVPYAVASGGFTRQTTPVGIGTFTSSEGAVSGGIGARIHLGRFYLGPEFRIGWEPLLQARIVIGIR